MRTLLHLSDLHFGRVNGALIEPLLAFARNLAPDLVVVSGDLTQRARTHQFEEARRFLDRLPHPQVVVPGNHDVPMFDVFSRFVRPREKFRRIISSNLLPEYVDEEIAVIGIDSSRSLTIKSGRINDEQIEFVRLRFNAMPANIIKIVVSHHPFDVPDNGDDEDLIGGAKRALHSFARGCVDLLLAGHLHMSGAAAAARQGAQDYDGLIVQAGTAISTRERGEANSFNVIHIDERRIVVECMTWQAAAADFVCEAPVCFEREPSGWQRV